MVGGFTQRGGSGCIPGNPGLRLGYAIRYVVGAERGSPGFIDVIRVAGPSDQLYDKHPLKIAAECGAGNIHEIKPFVHLFQYSICIQTGHGQAVLPRTMFDIVVR